MAMMYAEFSLSLRNDKDEDGELDHNAGKAGQNLIEFVNGKLFPYLKTFNASDASATTSWRAIASNAQTLGGSTDFCGLVVLNRSGRAVCQSRTRREHSRLRSVSNMQFFEKRPHVNLDQAFGATVYPSDLLVTEPFGKIAHQFQMVIAQRHSRERIDDGRRTAIAHAVDARSPSQMVSVRDCCSAAPIR